MNRIHIATLRQQLRKHAPFLSPSGDFFIKSVRSDKFNYVYLFIEELIHHKKKFPKRKRLKKRFTVTGLGIFSRTKTSAKYPLKSPQYTRSEKCDFTNFQSTSLGTKNFLPDVFGLVTRGDSLVGFMFESNSVLLSNRLYIYDTGTVRRYYDHDLEENAEKYADEFVNKILFSKDKFEEFKNQLTINQIHYNEALVRLQWACDGTCKIFIAIDSLESRLLAKQYANLLLKELIKTGKCSSNYVVPICFYTPDNAELLFKEYTSLEYLLDKEEAYLIFKNNTLRASYYKNEQYAFLLALSPTLIKKALDEEINNIPLAIHLLKNGFVHIYRFLTDNEYFPLEQALMDISYRIEYKEILLSILEHVIRSGDLNLVNIILNVMNRNPIFDIPVYLNTPIIVNSIENHEFDIAKQLIKSGYFDLNAENCDGDTALLMAAYTGQDDLIKLLLANNVDINAKNKNGHTALHCLTYHGHNHSVKLLLENNADTELTDELGNTSLITATLYGNTDIVQLLLKYNADTEVKNYFFNTALHVAICSNQINVAKLLLENIQTVEVHSMRK